MTLHKILPTFHHVWYFFCFIIRFLLLAMIQQNTTFISFNTSCILCFIIRFTHQNTDSSDYNSYQLQRLAVNISQNTVPVYINSCMPDCCYKHSVSTLKITSPLIHVLLIFNFYKSFS